MTLTYDKKSLPPDGSLRVRDWQLFAKKLRNKMGKFRFFHCGEYGDRKGRPHYHAALFGLDFYKDRVFEQNSKDGHPLYTSAVLAECWPHGAHWIGALTFESAAYVARYILKKNLGEHAWRRYGMVVDLDQGEAGTVHAKLKFKLKPEYVTMSRQPGIGKTWIDKYMSDVYPHDQVVVRGKISRPPKYYDQQYELIDPEGYKKMKIARAIAGEKYKGDQTPDRLQVREQVQQAEISAFTREI